MKDRVAEKLSGGRPVRLAPEEAAHFTEALREAVAVALETSADAIGDDQTLAGELGLDSIDLFDVLDQMGETYGIQVALEALPADWLRGETQATFRDLAQGLLAYLAEAPGAAAASGGGAG